VKVGYVGKKAYGVILLSQEFWRSIDHECINYCESRWWRDISICRKIEGEEWFNENLN